MILSSLILKCNNANAVWSEAALKVRVKLWKGFLFISFIFLPVCSHQLLSLDSPGCVLQDRVHHLWRVQLPKLPENKDKKAALSLTSAEGGPPAITLEAHKVILITD